MIIVPLKPKVYKEITCVDREILSVDYQVDTIVTFKTRIVEKHMVDFKNNDSITVNEYYDVEPEESYMFTVTVKLTGEEYDKNRRNEKEYVCNIAMKSTEYKRLLEECLLKVSDDREYEVESFISNREDGRKFKIEKYEYKKYIPV